MTPTSIVRKLIKKQAVPAALRPAPTAKTQVQEIPALVGQLLVLPGQGQPRFLPVPAALLAWAQAALALRLPLGDP